MAVSCASTTAATNARERELVSTRIFDAPHELVFKVWTKPERVKRWWGRNGRTLPVCKIDLRRGRLEIQPPGRRRGISHEHHC
jgi:uncharacterized protein YndB with AHSA1/START domain